MSEGDNPPDCSLRGVLLTVAYDGRGFAGYQKQRAQRTVQGELEGAILQMTGTVTEVRGAGRTDAGVHDADQKVAFDTDRDISPYGFMMGLNAKLGADVGVVAAEACASGYSPRFDAVDKTYRYQLLLAPTRHPLFEGRVWHMRHELDLDAMRDAGARLVGTHSFHAFRASDDVRPNTVRTLHSVEVTPVPAEHPGLVRIEVCGSAFMKQMVRILVGTLVEVGKGKRTSADVTKLLHEDYGRPDAGPTAPAEGLMLLRVRLGRGA